MARILIRNEQQAQNHGFEIDLCRAKQIRPPQSYGDDYDAQKPVQRDDTDDAAYDEIRRPGLLRRQQHDEAADNKKHVDARGKRFVS